MLPCLSVIGCLPRKVTETYYLEESETSMVFTVNTCSRIHVLLKTSNMQPPRYLLEFRGSDSEPSKIGNIETGETASEPSSVTHSCTTDRSFWVSRSNGVISGGRGGTPGKKEVLRLTQSKNVENVAMTCKMSTHPADENAHFAVFHRKMFIHSNTPI